MGYLTLTRGYYYIDRSATGKITVHGRVTLDGDGQSLTGIGIYASKGSIVTVKDVNINNPATVITLDSAELKIEGENNFIDSCTESGNKNPCIMVKGTSYISGSGSRENQRTGRHSERNKRQCQNTGRHICGSFGYK